MSVSVAPVTSRADLRAFVQLPYDLYRDHRAFVPPLRKDTYHALDPHKNAFFEHGNIQPFLARDAKGDVVGRIAAIRSGTHLEKYHDDVGFFGFFEARDDAEGVGALVDAAAAWLRPQHLRAMRGPTNPSINDIAGLLVDGFETPPSVLMPYNAPYYEARLKEQGFGRVMTMYAYFLHQKYMHDEKLRRGVDLVRRRYPAITTRSLDMKRYDEEARLILDLYNEAWSDNWGSVPMTENEFRQLAKELRQIVDPDLVVFVEHEGTPIAFAVSIPNINQALRHVPEGRLLPLGLPRLLAYATFGAINEIRMPLMGVRRAWHGRGIDALVILETIDAGLAKGYNACEMSWVLDTNQVLKNALEHLGGVRDKTYVMLEKAL
jgi:GNAT superfamily N-acetyltransferase